MGAGVPYSQISAVLLPAGGLTWLLFDGTPQGLVLACACGIGAPAIELLLMKLLGLWHYDKPGACHMHCCELSKRKALKARICKGC